jgi:acetyl esterase/lipase
MLPEPNREPGPGRRHGAHGRGRSATRTGRVVVVLAVALLSFGCADDDGESSATTDGPEPTDAGTSPEAPLEVEVTQDVQFTSERNMDIYSPAEGSDWPVVVHFHGGARSPDDYEDFARSVAEQGVVVMVPEWRSLGPAGGSEDTICAVAFAGENGGDHGGDTDNVTLSGYSTGGYTALIHAFVGEAPPLPVTDCLVDPTMAAPVAVVPGGAPIFAADWARQGLLAQNPQWAALTPEQLDAFDPYLAIGRNPDLRVHLVFAEDDVGGNPNIQQPIAESNRDYLSALLDAGYDAEATELPGGHSDPVTTGSDSYEGYVSAVVETVSNG